MAVALAVGVPVVVDGDQGVGSRGCGRGGGVGGEGGRDGGGQGVREGGGIGFLIFD